MHKRAEAARTIGEEVADAARRDRLALQEAELTDPVHRPRLLARRTGHAEHFKHCRQEVRGDDGVPDAVPTLVRGSRLVVAGVLNVRRNGGALGGRVSIGPMAL